MRKTQRMELRVAPSVRKLIEHADGRYPRVAAGDSAHEGARRASSRSTSAWCCAEDLGAPPEGRPRTHRAQRLVSLPRFALTTSRAGEWWRFCFEVLEQPALTGPVSSLVFMCLTNGFFEPQPAH